jgi:hypothetical protein
MTSLRTVFVASRLKDAVRDGERLQTIEVDRCIPLEVLRFLAAALRYLRTIVNGRIVPTKGRRFVAELSLSQDTKAKWPTSSISAEAYLLNDEAPWSLRLDLWAPPDPSGKAFAWLSFLSPDAPYAELPLGSWFEVRMGRTALGLAVLRLFPRVVTSSIENDFVSDPTVPVRSPA